MDSWPTSLFLLFLMCLASGLAGHCGSEAALKNIAEKHARCERDLANVADHSCDFLRMKIPQSGSTPLR